MALIDELFGRGLTQKEIARIKANPAVMREVVDTYYADESDEAETVVTPPAAQAAATPPSAFSLADIEGALDKRLGNLDERIKTTAAASIEEVIKSRADELIGAATARSIRSADELNRVYRRHEKEFGEDFDSVKFDEYLTEQNKAGNHFPSITKAYEAWTSDRRIEKTIETRVNTATEELKKKKANNEMVPGVTPASARSPLSTFINRGKATDDKGTTAAQRAGQALSDRMAAQSNE
jgi:hypothetical protein